MEDSVHTRRRWQWFVAPGAEGDALPGAPSPWVNHRVTRIPLEEWCEILMFAQALDREAADRVWHQSNMEEESADAHYDPAELTRSIDFLEYVAKELESAPPLVAEPTEERPDAYVNEELARMTRNVKAVMEEALHLGELYVAWYE